MKCFICGKKLNLTEQEKALFDFNKIKIACDDCAKEVQKK